MTAKLEQMLAVVEKDAKEFNNVMLNPAFALSLVQAVRAEMGEGKVKYRIDARSEF